MPDFIKSLDSRQVFPIKPVSFLPDIGIKNRSTFNQYFFDPIAQKM